MVWEVEEAGAKTKWAIVRWTVGANTAILERSLARAAELIRCCWKVGVEGPGRAAKAVQIVLVEIAEESFLDRVMCG